MKLGIVTSIPSETLKPPMGPFQPVVESESFSNSVKLSFGRILSFFVPPKDEVLSLKTNFKFNSNRISDA